MSEDNTQKLTDGEKLILERIAKLEAQATNTTRLLLDQLIKEMTQTRDMLMEEFRSMNNRLDGVERELRSINHRLSVFADDINKIRGEMRELDARVDALDQRPN